MAVQVDERAFVHPGAQLEDGVVVGPYACVGDGVRLGSGTRVGAHAVVEGPTVIGRNNAIWNAASIGTAPQDVSYKGDPTRLEIGDDNTFREFVTVNRGTVKGGGLTSIGSGCMLMAYAHIAHDCRIGDGVVLANAVNLGGHVTLGDGVWSGGLVGVHHFVTVGRFAFLAGCSKFPRDVPPFCLCEGMPGKVRGLNTVGLRRRGMDQGVQRALHNAVKLIYNSGLSVSHGIERAEAEVEMLPEVMELIAAIRASQAGVKGRAAEARRADRPEEDDE